LSRKRALSDVEADGLPWNRWQPNQADGVNDAPSTEQVRAARAKLYLTVCVSRTGIDDVLALKPPPHVGIRAPADFTKCVDALALKGTWRWCSNNHEDPTVLRYTGELVKQRPNHLGMQCAIDGVDSPALFVRAAPGLCDAGVQPGDATAPPSTPWLNRAGFSELEAASVEVTKLESQLATVYGEIYRLRHGRESHGSRAVEDSSVTDQAEAQGRQLEVELKKAQSKL